MFINANAAHYFLYGTKMTSFILHTGFGEPEFMQQNLSDGYIDRLRTMIDRLGTRKEAADIAGVSLDAVIRYLRGENQPSFMAISRLCEASGISMHWLYNGEGPMESHATREASSVRGIPVSGMAESKDAGWYNTQISSMQMTLDLPDPNAFATMVHGQNLIPEGLQPGFLCICSPMLKPVSGDIVHLKRNDGLCALRIFVAEENEWLVLKAYTDRDEKNSQRAFEDRVKRSIIAEIAPVVFVRRKA
jgi:DNA-binding phage protein